MKKHILIVDDEPDIRDVLAQALEVKGYRVTSAGAGHEALRLIKSDPPDLLVSDLQMEDADGLFRNDQRLAARVGQAGA